MSPTRKDVPDHGTGPLGGDLALEEGDFHSLSPGLARDAQYNDRRLRTRRKLTALGKQAVLQAKTAGVALECRTSLHNPHTFNGMRVERIWAYIMRAKAEKKRLKSLIGAELAKDLDSAYRNAYLCLAIEAEAVEVSLRIHPDAWYDGQNLKNRVEKGGPDELEAWRALLNALPGFTLGLKGWARTWTCGSITKGELGEFLGRWIPGEHQLQLQSRLPAPSGARGGALAPDLPEHLLASLDTLLPIYRFTAWSEESNFLFSG